MFNCLLNIPDGMGDMVKINNYVQYILGKLKNMKHSSKVSSSL